jgi:hypothetical protein
MHVARRQKFPAARGEPSVPRVGLALGAVSVSTRNGELTIILSYGEQFVMESVARERMINRAF